MPLASRQRIKSERSPAARLRGFVAQFEPGVRSVADAALAKLRSRLPGAVEFVYDTYYALVIGFGPTERPSGAVFSLVLYPRHVSLCFLQGALLEDGGRLLRGSGNQVRHIRLEDASLLDRPEIKALMKQAVDAADSPFDRKARRRLIIRAVSAKKRPRRPRA